MLKKVFIVDDNESVQTVLSELLASVGLDCQVFSSGVEFINAYDGVPGVLLLDLRMPNMSGLELQKQLNNKGYYLPIIFISGHGDIDIAVKALKMGAMDFITKPFKNQVVIDAVHAALQSESSQLAVRKNKTEALQKINALSAREKEILGAIIDAKKTKEIAQLLDISPNTVEVHRAQIMKKMQVRSLAQLVATTVKYDLLASSER